MFLIFMGLCAILTPTDFYISKISHFLDDNIPVTKAFAAHHKSSSIFKTSMVKSRKNTKYAIWCFSVSSSEIMQHEHRGFDMQIHW